MEGNQKVLSTVEGHDPVELAARELAIYHFEVEEYGPESDRALYHEGQKDMFRGELSDEQQQEALVRADKIIRERMSKEEE